jgi:transposase
LREQGHGSRAIATALGISRNAVKKVLQRASAEVPTLQRDEKAAAHHDQIIALLPSCKRNLVRVHEELLAQGAALSYQALTAYCRRRHIGHEPPQPAGRYHFGPGEEMQHDTSPHAVEMDGKKRAVQTASLVLCHSRMIFIQLYARFTRFECKVFLTDALRYFGGACARCMIDNTHVVVLRGTGKDMVPVPEMAAFAERFHFSFIAHDKGDANRSARVERPFHYIENNFLAGRLFADFTDLNQRAVLWCDEVNAKHRRKLHAAPRDLFAAERPRLKPLPAWIPPVYALHHRIVDVEGYVSVRGNRYSVPYLLIGHRVEARESKDAIEIYDGPRMVASHARVLEPGDVRVTDAAHRPPRGQGRSKSPDAAPAEERELLLLEPALGPYVDELKRRSHGRGTLALRGLLRIVRDYPREAVRAAVNTAAHYGLYDLDRIERLVLRNVSDEYFVLPATPRDDDEDEPR